MGYIRQIATWMMAAVVGLGAAGVVSAPASTATAQVPATSNPVHGDSVRRDVDQSADVSEQETAGAKPVADQSDQPKDAMPDNPSQKLPDKVSAAVPDDATVVAPDLAVTNDGEVKNLKTGAPVTDPKVVGTENEQPDPLAKTDGRRFIPVPASDVKDAVRDNGGDANAPVGGAENGSQATGSEHNTQSDAAVGRPEAQRSESRTASPRGKVQMLGTSTNVGGVQNAALQNNAYGAYWGRYNGTQAFFENGGNLFAQQAKGVIDVSAWQGDINWQEVKNSGVEGAIIRISYGWNNKADRKAQQNINECKRLGIPFGVYIYSYAANSNDGASEGRDVVKWLRNYGVSPSNLSYPVFYDLENWTDGGRVRPTSPNVYNGIVNSWYRELQAAGYNNLSVYSYTYYLNTALNSNNIRSKTRWVASYGARTGFSYSSNDRGWQYADNGGVRGIDGHVDINVFGNRNYVSTAPRMSNYRSVALPSGTYYVSAVKRDSAGLDIAGASTANNVQLQLYGGNSSRAQQFRLNRQNDGTYEIRNLASNKVLDIPSANAYMGAPVQQYAANGTRAQRWYLRDTGNGGMIIQSALGNWVLDLPNGTTANSTKIRLWEPNLSSAQQFIFSTVSAVPQGTVKISSMVNGSKVMDIPAASKADNARTQVYAWNGTDAQLFRFNKVGNAIYEIINVNSGKAVNLAAANTKNGAAVNQFSVNHTCAQRWAIHEQGSGQYSFYSTCAADKPIDIPAANASNGVGLSLYAGNGTSAQRWKVTSAKTARETLNDLAKSHRKDLADGTYTFGTRNKTAQKLDVRSASRANGGVVQLYAGNRTNAQKWRITHDANGYVTFKNVGSGKVLDVPAGRDGASVKVQQYQSNGTYAQKWIAVRQGNSYKFVSALDKNLVLDVEAGQTGNNALVQIYTDNGTNAQRWVSGQ